MQKYSWYFNSILDIKKGLCSSKNTAEPGADKYTVPFTAFVKSNNNWDFFEFKLNEEENTNSFSILKKLQIFLINTTFKSIKNLFFFSKILSISINKSLKYGDDW